MKTDPDQREIWFSIRYGKIGPVHRKGWFLYAALIAVLIADFVSSFLWAPSLVYFAVATSIVVAAVIIFLVLTIMHFGKRPS